MKKISNVGGVSMFEMIKMMQQVLSENGSIPL
ncbi:hypothetical protein BMEGG_01636 [Priestia megaterium]